MLKKVDLFIFGLMIMILLAFFFPQAGIYNGTVNLESITDIGISLIFFFYGLKLSPAQMKDGLRNYRLHILVQLATFVLFPLLVIAFLPFVNTEEQQLIWLAMFFLAALPSTVSSSVVMVVLAKGNIAGAIFNASISGLIGIIITPLWLGLFWQSDGVVFNFSDIILSLFLKILVPVFFGLILHRYLGLFVKKHLKKIAWFDKLIILLIVYKSFSKSFTVGVFDEINISDLALIGGSSVLLLFVVYGVVGGIAGLLKFNREDRIAALFCGSKKSLVHGTVFSKVLLANVAGQGLFLVPVMIYHSLQLIVISFIASREGNNQ